ncbi:MAG: rhodanese-like domain-containing protein [Bauldia sp.]
MRLMEWIDPAAAARLVESGALLVDIREAEEYAHASIPGSQHLPLSRLAWSELTAPADRPVIFLCASGGRTQMAENRLAEIAGTRPAYILAGGILGWQRAGLPIEKGAGEAGPARRGFLGRLFAS